MGFSLPFWYFLPLLALVPLIYRRAKEKAAAAPVTTISLARYRLLASIMSQRKVARGPVKPPVLLFIAAALAIVAASQPIPGLPAPSHGVALVVAVETGQPMNQPGPAGGTRLDAARVAANGLLQALAPGDPVAVIFHDDKVQAVFPLGFPPAVASNALDSITSGARGNSPGLAMKEATRMLASINAPRRVVVLLNDGDGVEESASAAVAALSEPDLPLVEGYLVNLAPTQVGLSPYGAAPGWQVVDLKDWSPDRVVFGSPSSAGELAFPLGAFIALAAFGLTAFVVFKEARRA